MPKTAGEAVNIVQIASGLAYDEGTRLITASHVEWVLNNGQHSPGWKKKSNPESQVGYVGAWPSPAQIRECSSRWKQQQFLWDKDRGK